MSEETKATLMFLFPGIIFIKGTSIGVYKNNNDYTIIESNSGNELFTVTAISFIRRGKILIFWDGANTTTVFNCKNLYYRILNSVVMYRSIGNYKAVFNYKESIVFYKDDVIIDCETKHIKINEEDSNFPLSVTFQDNRNVTFDKDGNELSPIDVICSREKFKTLYRAYMYDYFDSYIGIDYNNQVYKYDRYGMLINTVIRQNTDRQINEMLNKFRHLEVIICNGKFLQ